MRQSPHRDPARRRGRERRPARLGGVLRSPVRYRAGPRVERALQRPPAQLRRQPRRQASPAHDRHRPGALLRTNSQLNGPPPRLKRFVARELYRTLRADLATLTTRT